MNDQNRNKRLRSFIHFLTKSEITGLLIKMVLHINTAEDLLHFQSPKLCDSPKVPTAWAELSLPGSLWRLTEKPFKWNYSGFTKWRRRKWTDCSGCPASPVQAFQFLVPFPDLLLSSWPSRSCSTVRKLWPKSISIKNYRDYNHQDPHSSAMECNW